MGWKDILKVDELEKKGLQWFYKNGKKKFLLDKDGVRHAAGAAVFKGDKILLVERSEQEDTMHGLWEFAGGKLEHEDEFFEDGSPNAEKVALIEISEELGLKGSIVKAYKPHYDGNMNPPKKYHCFRMEVKEDWEPTLSEEHSDHKWVTVEEALEIPSNEMSHHARFVLNQL